MLRAPAVRGSLPRSLAVALAISSLALAHFADGGQAREATLEPMAGGLAEPQIQYQEFASEAPLRVTTSSRGASRSPNPDISTRDQFIAVVAEAAQDSQRTTGVPASVTIAQAILESNWGNSVLAKRGLNFFGIKAKGGPGSNGIIRLDTWEVLRGVNTTVNDTFRAYKNIFDSIEDHGKFLRNNPRYSDAFRAGDPKEFARRIHRAGYATDPGYSTKLIGIMDRYNLYRYDLAVPMIP